MLRALIGDAVEVVPAGFGRKRMAWRKGAYPRV